MNQPITYLFVPGNRPERFDKAFATDAGAIILDLEDAVIPAEKAVARAAIADWFGSHPAAANRVAVRINDTQSHYFADDIRLMKALGIRQIMLPKAESKEQVTAVVNASGAAAKVLPLIETARGVANVDGIASAEGVVRLAFGTLDYAVDLDLSGDEAGLAYPSARIAIASRCADLPSPVAGVTPSIDDFQRIRDDFALARAYGFGAKLCIHPKQVEIVHAACKPTAEEQAWAQRVLAAAETSEGAVQLDGKMIDRPVVLKAQAILARSSFGQTN